VKGASPPGGSEARGEQRQGRCVAVRRGGGLEARACGENCSAVVTAMAGTGSDLDKGAGAATRGEKQESASETR
jgi:hypothetical protein